MATGEHQRDEHQRSWGENKRETAGFSKTSTGLKRGVSDFRFVNLLFYFPKDYASKTVGVNYLSDWTEKTFQIMLDTSRGFGLHLVYPPLGRAPSTLWGFCSLHSFPARNMGIWFPLFLEVVAFWLFFIVFCCCCCVSLKLMGELIVLIGEENAPLRRVIFVSYGHYRLILGYHNGQCNFL